MGCHGFAGATTCFATLNSLRAMYLAACVLRHPWWVVLMAGPGIHLLIRTHRVRLHLCGQSDKHSGTPPQHFCVTVSTHHFIYPPSLSAIAVQARSWPSNTRSAEIPDRFHCLTVVSREQLYITRVAAPYVARVTAFVCPPNVTVFWNVPTLSRRLWRRSVCAGKNEDRRCCRFAG